MARLNGRILSREPPFDSLSQSKKDPMNKSSMSCVLGAILLTSCAWAQVKSASETEKAIFALEHQWLKSQKTNDVELLVPLLADQFVQTSSEGKVTNTKQTLAIANEMGQCGLSGDEGYGFRQCRGRHRSLHRERHRR
jgi:hypothetical protein